MTKKDAFFTLIGLFERTNIRYALVGNTDEYPDHIDSDVDIVTDEPGLAIFHREIWSLERSGLRVVQRFQHEITAFYYVLAFQTPDGGWGYLQPDICTDYYRKAIKLLDAVPMLDRRRRVDRPDIPGGGFWALHPADEFLYYLLKKIGKKSLSSAQFRHLCDVFLLDPDACREALSRFPTISDQVISSVQTNDETGLSAALASLKRSLVTSRSIPKPCRFRDAIRKIGRVFRPTGFVVVALGKSSGQEWSPRLHAALSGAFRRQADFHAAKAGLFRKLLAAKIASTFVLLEGNPSGLSRLLVDLMPSGQDVSEVASAVLDALSIRVKRRHCPVRKGVV